VISGVIRSCFQRNFPAVRACLIFVNESHLAVRHKNSCRGDLKRNRRKPVTLGVRMPRSDPELKAARDTMVRRQVESRGVTSPRVLDAMREVPREAFLPEHMREFAFEDAPLPIDESQTISQPYIVAFMVEALNLAGGEKVLEIGTGSGYAAAILAEIEGEVYTVERFSQLAQKGAAVLSDLGYRNVHVLHADGTRGWPEHAPYDAIVVAAGAAEIPQSLKTQLIVGGRLVIPVGSDPRVQELLRVTRTSENEWKSEELADVRFVPLIGEEV